MAEAKDLVYLDEWWPPVRNKVGVHILTLQDPPCPSLGEQNKEMRVGGMIADVTVPQTILFRLLDKT